MELASFNPTQAANSRGRLRQTSAFEDLVLLSKEVDPAALGRQNFVYPFESPANFRSIRSFILVVVTTM